MYVGLFDTGVGIGILPLPPPSLEADEEEAGTGTDTGTGIGNGFGVLLLGFAASGCHGPDPGCRGHGAAPQPRDGQTKLYLCAWQWPMLFY